MAKTILAVLAHSDDESFGLGGTRALYARKGYDTDLVCEKPVQWMRSTAKILGLKEAFFPAYRD